MAFDSTLLQELSSMGSFMLQLNRISSLQFHAAFCQTKQRATEKSKTILQTTTRHFTSRLSVRIRIVLHHIVGVLMAIRTKLPQ